MIIEIPGYKTLDLDYLVLDYNGTIAVDGLIPPAIKERLLLLGDSFKIYVPQTLTALRLPCATDFLWKL